MTCGCTQRDVATTCNARSGTRRQNNLEVAIYACRLEYGNTRAANNLEGNSPLSSATRIVAGPSPRRPLRVSANPASLLAPEISG